jgi:hypothetical protein
MPSSTMREDLVHQGLLVLPSSIQFWPIGSEQTDKMRSIYPFLHLAHANIMFLAETPQPLSQSAMLPSPDLGCCAPFSTCGRSLCRKLATRWVHGRCVELQRQHCPLLTLELVFIGSRVELNSLGLLICCGRSLSLKLTRRSPPLSLERRTTSRSTGTGRRISSSCAADAVSGRGGGRGGRGWQRLFSALLTVESRASGGPARLPV